MARSGCLDETRPHETMVSARTRGEQKAPDPTRPCFIVAPRQLLAPFASLFPSAIAARIPFVVLAALTRVF